MITAMAEEMRRWLMEMAAVYTFSVLLGVTFLLLAGWFGRMYVRFHGPRTVVCPETGTSAVVHIGAGRAAFSTLFGHPDVHLVDCSRWKERGECDQPCVKQLRP